MHLNALKKILVKIEKSIAARMILESMLVRANIMRRQGSFKEALTILSKHDIGYWQHHHPHLIPERLLIEGACRFYLKDIGLAEKNLESALGLATFHSDARLRSRILIMMGILAQVRGFTRKAEDYYIRARNDCVSRDDYYGEAAACLNLGIVLYRCGKFKESTNAIKRAQNLFKIAGWSLGVCRCTLALGNVKKCQGELRSSIRLYRKAEKMASNEGLKREQSLAFEYIGDIFFERKKLDVAERYYQKCLQLARSIAPKGDVEVEVLRRLGELNLMKEDHRIALSFLNKGLDYARTLQDRLEEALIMRALGRLNTTTGDIEEGIAHFKGAITILKDASCNFELAKTHVCYAQILLEEISDLERREIRSAGDGFETDDEAWKSLIEANYLLREISTPYLAAKIKDLYTLVLKNRRTLVDLQDERNKGKHIIRLTQSSDYVLYKKLIGVSHGIQQVWQQIQFSANFTRPILITGETGTGKELVARTIHMLSDNGKRPFVAVNCAAIPDHLFESEFFGHRKGCFTGAMIDRKGIFEEANGGTLFLDEIGELTPLQQVKLLRVLQECSVRRIGENTERPIHIRIISATNQNLEEKIESTILREDFYYRINSEHIHIPPLRERPEDIVPLIVSYLCGNDRGEEEREVLIDKDALTHLQKYTWPGNVRELFAVLERAKHLRCSGPIMPEMLPVRVRNGAVSRNPEKQPYLSYGSKSKVQLEKALTLCRGNKAATARCLGISRGTLYKELRRTGLEHFIRQKPAS
ncbi:MAG: sigma 54-interacting transcriptional regulator [bacterium]|nr:MAG: sigma 54-interacting transcriptional regulator [bacterium]